MKELEDQAWFPPYLRRHQMEFLSMVTATFGLYTPAADLIFENIPSADPPVWTDLCSGCGGPVLALQAKTDRDSPILLTDLYPQSQSTILPGHMKYYSQPVDVKKDDIPGNGLITMFNSFHHFSQKEQETILQKIAGTNRPFICIEILNPGILCFLQVLVTSTIGHWLLVPFMKPFSLKRIFFTYIIPINTLSVLIDGLISVIKSDSESRFRQLCKQSGQKEYQFNFEKIKGVFTPLYIIKGSPVI